MMNQQVSKIEKWIQKIAPTDTLGTCSAYLFFVPFFIL